MIIYKGKAEELLPLVKMLVEENSVISIVCGDLAVNNIEKLLGRLPAAAAELLQMIPPSLWLGDKIIKAFPGVMTDNRACCMVISDKAVYFISANYTGEPDWDIIAYEKIRKLKQLDAQNCQISFADGRKEKFLRIPNDADEACLLINEQLLAGSFQLLAIISCASCGYSEKKKLLDVAGPSCLQCAAKLSVKLICPS